MQINSISVEQLVRPLVPPVHTQNSPRTSAWHVNPHVLSVTTTSIVSHVPRECSWVRISYATEHAQLEPSLKDRCVLHVTPPAPIVKLVLCVLLVHQDPTYYHQELVSTRALLVTTEMPSLTYVEPVTELVLFAQDPHQMNVLRVHPPTSSVRPHVNQDAPMDSTSPTTLVLPAQSDVIHVPTLRLALIAPPTST